MSWDLVLKRCATIRVSLTQQQVGLELLASQLSGIESEARQQLQIEELPRAEVVLPESCNAYSDNDCARRSEDGLIEGREGWAPMCRGCGLNPRQPVS